MNQRTARRWALILVLALCVYFVLIGYRGVYLLGRSGWDLKLFGIVVLVFPLIGVWVVAVELRFGFVTQRLAEQLNAEGADPEPELPRLPSGRVDRGAADALFEVRKAEVEVAPENWRGWYHLSIAYDAAGDRRRARAAMRTAAQKRLVKD